MLEEKVETGKSTWIHCTKRSIDVLMFASVLTGWKKVISMYPAPTKLFGSSVSGSSRAVRAAVDFSCLRSQE